jgi:hypothetical protein
VAFFRVVLDGTGTDIPAEENGPSIIGFFTTRLVRAATTIEAEKKAKGMVLNEWSSGRYAKANKGSLPVVSVESVEKSNLLESLRFKNKGYSFYMEEQKEETNKTV